MEKDFGFARPKCGKPIVIDIGGQPIVIEGFGG